MALDVFCIQENPLTVSVGDRVFQMNLNMDIRHTIGQLNYMIEPEMRFITESKHAFNFNLKIYNLRSIMFLVYEPFLLLFCSTQDLVEKKWDVYTVSRCIHNPINTLNKGMEKKLRLYQMYDAGESRCTYFRLHGLYLLYNLFTG